MIRVLVAEDSLTMQNLLVAVLEHDPDLRVVGRATTGAEAVENTERLRPDVITMDIHMPVMDGVEATKEIMARTPTPIVVVASSRSRADSGRSVQALRAGAMMIIPKPENPGAPTFDGRARHVREMVRTAASIKVVRRWPRIVRDEPARAAVIKPRAGVRVVAIAASTGGPQALLRLLADLPRDFPVPILIVQHIAPGFVSAFAEWLALECDLRVRVATDGEALEPRTVLIAPDGAHLGVTADGRVALSPDPPIAGQPSSGTYLFRSVARAYGSGAVAVILSGMGRDGVDGLADIADRGGYIIAQDPDTAVVRGMPGDAVEAGLADAILAPSGIARALTQLVGYPHA